jgi:hypothetical protein
MSEERSKTTIHTYDLYEITYWLITGDDSGIHVTERFAAKDLRHALDLAEANLWENHSIEGIKLLGDVKIPINALYP